MKIITEIEIINRGVKSRFELAEGRVSKFEDRSTGIIQFEQKEKIIKESKRVSKTCETPPSIPAYEKR